MKSTVTIWMFLEFLCSEFFVNLLFVQMSIVKSNFLVFAFSTYNEAFMRSYKSIGIFAVSRKNTMFMRPNLGSVK